MLAYCFNYVVRRIVKYCQFCCLGGNFKNIPETVTHLLNCQFEKDHILSVARPIEKEIIKIAQNRLKNTKQPGVKNLCVAILESKIHNARYVDICLGVGAIQMLKYLNNKRWSVLCQKIYKIQENIIIPVLERKNRIHKTYKQKILALEAEEKLSFLAIAAL